MPAKESANIMRVLIIRGFNMKLFLKPRTFFNPSLVSQYSFNTVDFSQIPLRLNKSLSVPYANVIF